METRDLIPIEILCKRYNIPVSFINNLREFQLIEIIVEENDFYIHTTQIKAVEKMMRLHYELDINFEGMDVIFNLLKKVELLNEDIIALHNRLKCFVLD